MKHTIWDLVIIICFAMVLFAHAALSHAGNVKHVLDGRKNESFTVQCVNGTLALPDHSSKSFVLKCTGGAQPPEPPATGCSNPDRRALKLPLTREFITIRYGTALTYWFCSDDYKMKTGQTSVAGSPKTNPNVSYHNQTVLSVTPGVVEFDYRSYPRVCWGAGAQANLQYRVGKTAGTICGLKPKTIYYISVTPRNPVNGAKYCKSGCGAVIESGR